VIVFVLKNLLILSACVLVGVPCLLAVLNFRRRTAAKRRALTNLLSDPRILAQYVDRFPSRKGLTDAQSIADDYFKTYFNRSEYVTALVFNFLTCSLALIFVLAQINFSASFIDKDVVMYVQGASFASQHASI
jgi:hypothetical protein